MGLYNWLQARFRPVARLSQDVHQITPTWFITFVARSSTRDIQKQFSEIKSLNEKKQIDEINQNIPELIKDIKIIYEDLIGIELDITTVEQSEHAIEYGILHSEGKFLRNVQVTLIKKLRNTFHNYPIIKHKINQICIRLLESNKKEREEIELVKDEARRQTIDRKMLKDFDLRELLLIYFQIRSAIKTLKKNKYRLEHQQYKIIRKINGVVKTVEHVTERSTVKLPLDHQKVENLFRPIGEDVRVYIVVSLAATKEWLFISKMLNQLRDKLRKESEKQNRTVERLMIQNFPQSIDIENLQKKLHHNLTYHPEIEYQRARANRHVAEQNNNYARRLVE